ncbi:MAG: hypothetical protein A2007_01585 [Verrucomicrobia bacterium GWC2_42_7]|nr:MAG: hypothetical protein A2007_01585 [Verrucomicrobia bacterium GWC2_42_7]
MRKPFFSREKKSFRAFQRKAIVAKTKSIDFPFAKGMVGISKSSKETGIFRKIGKKRFASYYGMN